VQRDWLGRRRVPAPAATVQVAGVKRPDLAGSRVTTVAILAEMQQNRSWLGSPDGLCCSPCVAVEERKRALECILHEAPSTAPA
jgi:hypothetical protein